jgi:hypothetical protein
MNSTSRIDSILKDPAISGAIHGGRWLYVWIYPKNFKAPHDAIEGSSYPITIELNWMPPVEIWKYKKEIRIYFIGFCKEITLTLEENKIKEHILCHGVKNYTSYKISESWKEYEIRDNAYVDTEKSKKN